MQPSRFRRPSSTSHGLTILAVATVAGWIGPLASAAPRSSAPVTSAIEQAVVVEVLDGDTVVVELQGGRRHVRLTGIDTPETHHPEELPQYLGEQAQKALQRAVLGKTVNLVHDAAAGSDRHGRDLAYVELGGQDIGEQQLRAGLAIVWRQTTCVRRARYLQVEAEAEAQGVGLWADHGLAEFRWLQSQSRSPIELMPMSSGRYAASWNGWVALYLTPSRLDEACHALRHAMALINDQPERAAELLRAAGFTRVTAPAPSAARPDPDRKPAPR